MSIFVNVSSGVAPKTDSVRKISLLFAGILVVMAVAQLFTYEDFPSLIKSFLLPTGDRFAYLLAALIVSFEVFAVPFLLGMSVSPLMRWLSMICSWAAAGIWIFISLWLNFTNGIVTSAGLLGATVKLPSGWWTVFFSLALGVLAIWASWGMWPGHPKKK
ncbi:MAG: hypothetical protein ABIQ04_00920 [Candidatus Saccharimonadales bacterium]